MRRQQKHKERTAAKIEGRARPKTKQNKYYNSFNSKAKLNRKEKILIMSYKAVEAMEAMEIIWHWEGVGVEKYGYNLANNTGKEWG